MMQALHQNFLFTEKKINQRVGRYFVLLIVSNVPYLWIYFILHYAAVKRITRIDPFSSPLIYFYN